jgi:hypothetical protein
MELSLGLSLSALAARQAGGPSYDAASLAIFAAMTTPPTTARKALIDARVKVLKAAGAWDEMDVLYMLAAADEQAARLNWKNPGTLTLSLVNSPTFAVDQGYKGDGISGALTSAYNPTTFSGAKFVQNSACFGVYVRQLATINASYILNLGSSRFQSRSNVGDGYQTRLNDATTTPSGALNTGHFAAKRSAANAKTLYRSGIVLTTDSSASIAVANAAANILSFGGTAYSDAQLSFLYFGSGNVDIAATDAALMAYLQDPTVGAA